MRKGWLGFLLSICLCLTVISGWLLIHPITALALASCVVDCGQGHKHTCTGDSCTATDGVGCTATINGITSEAPCSGHGGIQE
jgi:hypothetical protein